MLRLPSPPTIIVGESSPYPCPRFSCHAEIPVHGGRRSCGSGVLALVLSAIALGEEPSFRGAKPIWPSGRETEMNLSVGFRAVIQAEAGGQATLRVAAATIYRAWVKGVRGRGPARGPHGYYRVDDWDLAGNSTPASNLVPSKSPDTMSTATTCWINRRFSRPRWSPAIRCWLRRPVAGRRWLPRSSTPACRRSSVTVSSAPSSRSTTSPTFRIAGATIRPARWSKRDRRFRREKRLLPRRVPYPEFACRSPVRLVGSGRGRESGPGGRSGKTAPW